MISRRKLLSATSLAVPALLLPSRKLILPEAKAQWSSCGAGFCNNGGATPPLIPTWSHVQGAANDAQSVTTITATLSSPVTNGNIVVGGALTFGANIWLISVTDDKGNTYEIFQQDGQFNSDGFNIGVAGFRSTAGITNAPTVFTFTMSASTSFLWGIVDEFSASFSVPNLYLDSSQVSAQLGPVSAYNYRNFQTNALQYNVAVAPQSITAGAGWTLATTHTTATSGCIFSEWKNGAAANDTNHGLVVSSGQVWQVTANFVVNAPTTWQLRQTQIQRTGNSIGVGGTSSISFNLPMKAGSIGIGAIAVGTAGGSDDDIANLSSLIDDKGNSWPLVGSGILGRNFFWSGGRLNNAPTTLTATVNHTETAVYFLINEFIPPPGSTVATDQVAYGSTGTGPPFTTPSITPSVNGSLVYLYGDIAGGDNAPGSPFTGLSGQGSTWLDSFIVQNTAAAITETFSSPNGVTVFTIGAMNLKAT